MRGAIYVLLPLVVVLLVAAVFAVLGWLAAQRDRQRAIARASWEFYSKPVRGGMVAYGTRKVARYGDQVLILQEDEAGVTSIDDEQAKLELAATAQNWTAFNNSLLPPPED
jgi:hypothetical protein